MKRGTASNSVSQPSVKSARSKKSQAGLISAYGDLPEFRDCSRCGAKFPATKKFFKTDDRRSDGLDPRCHGCFNRHNNKESNPRRLTFRGKRILQPSSPRKGICKACGKSVARGEIRTTSSHHYHYDDEHPERWTVEVCNGCHRKVHAIAKKRKISLRRVTEKVLGRRLPAPRTAVKLKCSKRINGGNIE